MISPNLSAIKDSLRKEKECLAAAASELRQKLISIESDLECVEAAAALLDGADAKTIGKRKSAKEKPKAAMRAANKNDVIQYMQSVLELETVLEEKELKERVEKLAQQDGYTRLGIGLRMKEAIHDERFVDTPGGVRLSLLSQVIA
jgi:hypothetical protein